MNGRNGTSIPDDIVEVPANVPDLLHDVVGTVVDFVSDGQTVNVVRSVLPQDIDERADLIVDLEGDVKFSSPEDRDLGLTLEEELAIVPSDFVRISKRKSALQRGQTYQPRRR